MSNPYSTTKNPLLSRGASDDESSDLSVLGIPLTPAVEAVLKECRGLRIGYGYTFRLLHSMLKNEKNFVMCPLTALSSIVSIIMGANGSCLSEMTRSLFNIVLQTEDEELLLIKQIKTCLDYGFKDKAQWIKSPTYLYVHSNFNINDQFTAYAIQFFGVKVKSTNFSPHDILEINELIKYDSDSLIGSTVKELGEGINLLLLDCIYFCGLWKYGFFQFRPSLFSNYNGTTSEIDFMHGIGKFKVGYNDYFRCHVIELPYSSEMTRMIICMPEKEATFVPFIEATANIVNQQLLDIISGSALRYRDIEVWLPKFKSEFVISMKGFYRYLGIHQIFDSTKADFSRLVNSADGLFLGDVVQKTIFEVKANGSRTLKLKDVLNQLNEEKLEVFRCNKPFMFFVVSEVKKTQICIFQGVVKVL